ncbi:MAG: uroporphyrinogen-III synthase [Planctomycetota bacterium]
MSNNDQTSETASPSALQGLTVLVTRPEHQSATFVENLLQAGAVPLLQPVIKITRCDSADKKKSIQTALSQIDQYDTLVFVSSNGVSCFAEECESLGIPPSTIARKQLIAIGASTQSTLRTTLLRDSWGQSRKQLPAIQISIPQTANSESLAELLIRHHSDQRLLILRGNRGSSVLAERLVKNNVSSDELVIYQSLDVAAFKPEIAAKLSHGSIDWVTLTSSASATRFFQLAKPLINLDDPQFKIASISPTTSQAIRDAGFIVDAEASRYDIVGMMDAMSLAEAGQG